MQPDDFLTLLQNAQSRLQATRDALGPYAAPSMSEEADPVSVGQASPSEMKVVIHDELANLSPALANGYAQVYRDLADTSRTSWAGSAHEIREVLAAMLRTLAPDSEVKSQHWFSPETDDEKPTHRQRVRYILRQRRAGSKETAVAEQAEIVETMIENLVRSIYTRASDAAHRGKDRSEVRRIVGYFEAFAPDLLNLH